MVHKKRFTFILCLLTSICFFTVAHAEELKSKDIVSISAVSDAITSVKTQDSATVKDYLYEPQSQEEYDQEMNKRILATYAGVKVTVEDALNMRTHPEDGTIIRFLMNGTVCKLLGIEGDWYKISIGSHVGYIKAEYATLVSTTDFEETYVPATVMDDLISEALTWIGTRYRSGGSSKSGTDCSGFTMAIFSEYGISLPHGAADQYYVTTPITTAERTTGDLVFFSSYAIPHGIAHVGIYLGNGQFIHASSSYGVIISSVYEGYYAQHYIGASRVSGMQ